MKKHPLLLVLSAAISLAAAHPELNVVFKDAQNDTLKQRSQIEEFVNSGVDLLIVSPKEAAPLTPPVAAAFRKGIPVIVLDRKVLGADLTQFIGADNRKIGRSAGDWMIRRLRELPAVKARGRARVVELKGLMTSTPGQDRHAGFRDALKGQPVDVIFDTDMKWLEPEARKEMESALAVHKDIDLVYAHNDAGAHGAYLAASFEYPTGGAEAIASALKLLRGETVPKEITLKSRVFTKDNVAAGGEWLP